MSTPWSSKGIGGAKPKPGTLKRFQEDEARRVAEQHERLRREFYARTGAKWVK